MRNKLRVIEDGYSYERIQVLRLAALKRYELDKKMESAKEERRKEVKAVQ